MTAFLYSTSIHIYGVAIRIAALWSPKARKWLSGRRQNIDKLRQWRSKVQQPVVWVHCASHGEYEQVLPLIVRIRREKPQTALALTFFSPSGFEAVADTAPVDWVGYIPLDTRSNAATWLDTMMPETVIFVKNEWWWHILTAAQSRSIPLHIVSATIRGDHYFLKYAGTYMSNCLNRLSSVGVVDEGSKERLSAKVPTDSIYISGDMRADQVARIALQRDTSSLSQLSQSSRYLIYGSVWQEDIPSIQRLLKGYPEHIHLLFPHRLETAYVEEMRIALDAAYYSESNTPRKGDIVLVNKLGLLSRAYRYGQLAYVGGGYGEGVHNVLEAAIYGIPTLIGPRHSKSAECLDLLEKKLVYNVEQLEEQDLRLLTQEDHLASVREGLSAYFDRVGEASEITYNHIFGPSQ